MKPKMELRKQEMNDITERLDNESFEFKRIICGDTELRFRKDIRRVLRPKKPLSKGRRRLKLKVRKPRIDERTRITIDCFLSERNMKISTIMSMYGTIFWTVGYRTGKKFRKNSKKGIENKTTNRPPIKETKIAE